jgi:hypothetical protein
MTLRLRLLLCSLIDPTERVAACQRCTAPAKIRGRWPDELRDRTQRAAGELPRSTSRPYRCERDMHLYYAKCGRQLTQECRPGTVSDYNWACERGEPGVAPGIIVDLSLDEAEHAAERVQSTRVQHGAFVVNLASVLRSLLKSTGVDSGCCGSDGCDGPNRACICGAVLGTERSDCWTPAEIRFLLDAVIPPR